MGLQWCHQKEQQLQGLTCHCDNSCCSSGVEHRPQWPLYLQDVSLEENTDLYFWTCVKSHLWSAVQIENFYNTLRRSMLAYSIQISKGCFKTALFFWDPLGARRRCIFMKSFLLHISNDKTVFRPVREYLSVIYELQQLQRERRKQSLSPVLGCQLFLCCLSSQHLKHTDMSEAEVANTVITALTWNSHTPS